MSQADSDQLVEAIRRIKRRLVGAVRRFLGRSPKKRTFALLPPEGRRVKIVRRPRIQRTRRTKPKARRLALRYYRRYRKKILSKLRQLRRLAWYGRYRKRMKQLAKAKGTRRSN